MMIIMNDDHNGSKSASGLRCQSNFRASFVPAFQQKKIPVFWQAYSGPENWALKILWELCSYRLNSTGTKSVPSTDSPCKGWGLWMPVEFSHWRVAGGCERRCQRCPNQPFSPHHSRGTSLGVQSISFKRPPNSSCIIQRSLHLMYSGKIGRARSPKCLETKEAGKALALLARAGGCLHMAGAKRAPWTLFPVAWQAGKWPCFLASLWVYCFGLEINTICHKKYAHWPSVLIINLMRI